MSEPEDQPVSETIAVLLAPVGTTGCGDSLRFTPLYRDIADARREENPHLPQGIWARDVKRADWTLVETLCTKGLRTRSKDLQLAAWLTEAWLHRRGAAGLADGLALSAGLCRQFWPGLHPEIDPETGDGDLTPRTAPFVWMNLHVPALLRAIPIVRAAGEPGRSHSWTDFINAQLLEGLRQRDPRSVDRAEAAGSVTLALFTETRRRTETGFLKRLDAELRAAAEALAALVAVLDACCGPEAPGLGAIDEALAGMMSMIEVELAERRRTLVIPKVPHEAAGPAAPPATLPPATGIATRERLYEQLGEIATLLHDIEPHSPVPYLIGRAVAWGSMPLGELLADFASTGIDLQSIFALLGLEHYGVPASEMPPRDATEMLEE